MAKASAIGPRSRKECQRSDHENRAQPEHAELYGIGTQRTGRRRQRRLRRHRTGYRHHKDDRWIAADKDHQAEGQIVPGRVGIQTGKGGPVIGSGGCESVEHFRIAVHRCIV